MLERAPSRGRTIHSQFREFPDFLAVVGPKPFPKATLDRINNDDPEYAPSKVRWADKWTQSNNRGNTLLFQSPDGRQFISSELAKLQKVSASAVRQRRRRAWTDDAIIAGRRLPPPPAPPVVEPVKAPTTPDNVLGPQLDAIWLQAMDSAYPGEWSALIPTK